MRSGLVLRTPLTVGAQLRDATAEGSQQRITEVAATFRTADRVEVQLGVRDPELAHEARRHLDDLGIQCRHRDAEGLHIQLMELSVATLLGTFVPKHWAEAVQPRGRHRLLERVLDEGAYHARSRLGSQRDVFTPFVREGVHLLLHDVGRFAGAFGEELFPLDDRRTNLCVGVPPTHVPRGVLETLPAFDFAWEDVTRSSNGGDHDDRYSLYWT